MRVGAIFNCQSASPRHIWTSECQAPGVHRKEALGQRAYSASRYMGRTKRWEWEYYCPHFKTSELWRKTEGLASLPLLPMADLAFKTKSSDF